MPEANDGTVGMPPAAPAGKVTLPPTEVERLKLKQAALEQEGDDDRSARRAKELGGLLDTHFANVKKSHEMYPTRQIPFLDMTEDEQRNWNEKRRDIDMANKAYHRAVKALCAEHRSEDIHLAKVRADAAKTAA